MALQSKRVLDPERVRKIEGSFSWIDHRFITGGCLRDLSTLGILLYLFLVAVSDRNGVSFYYDDRIASLLKIDLSALGQARAGLVLRALIAYEPPLYQVLSLPAHDPSLQRRKIPKGRRHRSILFQEDPTDAPMNEEEKRHGSDLLQPGQTSL